jgi:hypothetical protein
MRYKLDRCKYSIWKYSRLKYTVKFDLKSKKFISEIVYYSTTLAEKEITIFGEGLCKASCYLVDKKEATNELFKIMCLKIINTIKEDIKSYEKQIKHNLEMIEYRENLLKETHYIMREEKLKRLLDENN